MVYPKSLYEFGRSCTSSKTCGNILRALCGQKVSLSPSERTILAMVEADSRDMDERLEVRRTAERERKAAYRRKREGDGAAEREMSRVVPRDNTGQRGTDALSHGTGLGQNGVPHHTYIQTDIQTVHTDRPRVCVSPRPRAREDGTSYEQDGAGCEQPPPGGGEARADASPRRRVPPLADVVAAAESAMGVPGWYAAWWYRNMAASGWTTTKGERVGDDNWRALLKAWHNRALEGGREYERIRAEAEAAEKAEKAARRRYAAADWALCAERCAAFRDGRCAAGKVVPPQLRPHPVPPEECDGFAQDAQKRPSGREEGAREDGGAGGARSAQRGVSARPAQGGGEGEAR